jgi:aspartyl-tRNA(Asn)/glutamyl-tRNA(Gln) amidotransferase subunit A
VLDSAIALNAMVAYGAQDSTRVSEPPEDATSQLGLGASGLRVGVPTSYFFEDVDPQVTTAVERALNTLAKEGAELVSVAFDLSPLYMPVLFCIAVAEAGAFHHRTMLTQSHLYGDDVRAVFEAGMRMPAHGYITGLRGREIIKREWRTILEGVDVIVAPTHPTPAPMLGQEYVEWSGRLEAVNTAYSRLTGPANICGLPSASVPCGLSSDGLPIGCQVIGPPLRLKVARGDGRGN